LLRHVDVTEVDAVFISHGHPDHCADLNPLLRARALREDPAPPPRMRAQGRPRRRTGVGPAGHARRRAGVHDLIPGAPLTIGPFTGETRLLPHSRPNAGLLLTAGCEVFAYTDDAGPHPDTVALARDTDLFLAEASYVDEVPADTACTLSSAQQVGR